MQNDFLSQDETLKLPYEPDPKEKKNKRLEAELLRYKSREPVPAIRFKDGKNHTRFRIVSPSSTPDPEPEIQSKLAAAKEKCEPVELKPNGRSEEHTSELQSLTNLVCRLLLEKKKITKLQPKILSK